MGGETLAAAVRAALPGRSWNDVRRYIATGKVFVEGVRELDATRRMGQGTAITLRMNEPAPRKDGPPGFRIVHEDAHLIVIEKPEGIMTVPFERGDRGTALDLIRDAWRSLGRPANRSPLLTVHRLDKETSGLLVFAKTKAGERGLHDIFQRHLAERSYLALVHGTARSERIESDLVPDRGDGLRGTARGRPRGGGGGDTGGQRGRGDEEGQYAVTHVEVVEVLPGATLVRVRLETGRTHQIRIHLSEVGHPVVGEQVYIRDLRRAGQEELRSRRLMLHAETLAFDHPVTGERLSFVAEPPPSFAARLASQRGPRAASAPAPSSRP